MEKFLFNMAVVALAISSIIILHSIHLWWKYNFTKSGRMTRDFAYALGGSLKKCHPVWYVIFIISGVYIFSV